MDGSSGGFGGSRSEFLPGENYDDSDIKYQRYGGCFISFKKGVAYVLGSLTTVIVVSSLVYFYAPRWKDRTEYKSSANLETEELLQMGFQPPQTKADVEAQSVPNNLIPTKYRLFIQPYLDEEEKPNLTFIGNVSITFHVEGTSTKTIILNAKQLVIPNESVSITYFSFPKTEALKSESQVVANQAPAANTSLNTSTVANKDSTITASPAINLTSTTVAPSTSADNSTVVSPDTKKVIETNNSTINGSSLTPETADNKTESSSISSSTVPPSTTPSITNVSSPAVPSTTEVPPTVTPSSTVVSKPANNVSTTTNIPPATKTSFEVPSTGIETIIKSAKTSFDIKNQRYIIELSNSLEPGTNYTLTLDFMGNLSTNNLGFLRTYHQDNKTAIKTWSAVSNFQQSSARMGFPCFDEPKYKAKFEINLARKTNYVGLSNMPLKETLAHSSTNGWMWDIYDITPPMPSYSVAFIISNVTPRKIPSSEPGPVMNVWGRKEVIQKASYALDIAPKLLAFYNTFFGYHYPLSKLDFVAVPNLPVVSVDNWGLIYIREDIMLVDRSAPNYEKELLVKNMANNIARQWFGALVTVKHMNESWIMEALSIYMEYLGVNTIEPSWEILDDFSSTMTQKVLDSDPTELTDLDSVMTENYYEPSDLHSMKACALIRMLNNSLTDSLLIKGLRNYIDIWKYKNAEENSLWNELTQSAINSSILPKDISVRQIVDSWINNDGYPIVTITRDYNKGSVKIQQAGSTNDSTEKKPWVIPLNYRTSDAIDRNNKLWITQEFTTVENMTAPAYDKWLLFNVQQTSLCRVNYDVKNWNLLIALLHESPELLSPVNRAQLIDDAFHLARNGMLDYEVVLNLTSYLREKEKHYIPWAAAFRNFEYLDVILSKTPNYGYFQDYILKLLAPIYNELPPYSTESYSYFNTKLRALVVRWACKLHHKQCKDWAYSQFQTWANFTSPDDTNPTENELRSTMYCVGVQMRGRMSWDFLWTRFQNAKETNKEAKNLLTGMGCSKDAWVLIRYFQRILNVSQVNSNNAETAWRYLSSDYGISEAFQFLRDNWSNVLKQYKNKSNLIKSIINGPLSKLSTKNELDEVTRFFFANRSELNDFIKDMAQAAIKIKARVDWKEKYLNTVVTWLQNQNKI